MSDASSIKRVPVGREEPVPAGRIVLPARLDQRQAALREARRRQQDRGDVARDKRVSELRSEGKIELKVGEDLLSELAARFIEHQRGPSGKLTTRTCDLREQLLSKHVLPILGEMKARAITTPHVQALSDRLTSKASRVRACAGSSHQCLASSRTALGTDTSRATSAARCRCRQPPGQRSRATSITLTCCASWTPHADVQAGGSLRVLRRAPSLGSARVALGRCRAGDSDDPRTCGQDEGVSELGADPVAAPGHLAGAQGRSSVQGHPVDQRGRSGLPHVHGSASVEAQRPAGCEPREQARGPLERRGRTRAGGPA